MRYRAATPFSLSLRRDKTGSTAARPRHRHAICAMVICRRRAASISRSAQPFAGDPSPCRHPAGLRVCDRSGSKDADDLDALHGDPGLRLALGKLPQSRSRSRSRSAWPANRRCAGGRKNDPARVGQGDGRNDRHDQLAKKMPRKRRHARSNDGCSLMNTNDAAAANVRRKVKRAPVKRNGKLQP